MHTKKNVLVIYTDQQRYDACGYAGNLVARTPNIDALADDGLAGCRTLPLQSPIPAC